METGPFDVDLSGRFGHVKSLAQDKINSGSFSQEDRPKADVEGAGLPVIVTFSRPEKSISEIGHGDWRRVRQLKRVQQLKRRQLK